MRERLTLRLLRQVAATQGALQVASEASLAHAISVERARDADVHDAQNRLEAAIEDWREALTRSPVDASLLRLFAQAPTLRKSELNEAEGKLDQAQRQTDMNRLRLGEVSARLRRSMTRQRTVEKRLDRKLEEKALAALEHQVRGVGP